MNYCNYYNSKKYAEDLKNALESVTELEKLYHSHVVIAGGCGLIGSYIADMLMYADKFMNADISVCVLDRDINRLEERFSGAYSEKLTVLEHDVNKIPEFDIQADYIIHAASNAFPAAFSSDPVGTVMSNIQGTKYLLDYGRDHGCRRLLYISSGEVYGQGDSNPDILTEDFVGYVNMTSPRSCYPNSKRCAETLCVSYTQQYGLDTVIVRPSHTYGPTVTRADNRANAQFVNKGLAGEDIVMKSSGSQTRSYTYIADSASAILSVMTSGKSCEAYNIANPQAVTTIREYAEEVARQTGTKVIMAVPDEDSKRQMSPVERQVLSGEKLMGTGWCGKFTVPDGIKRTLEIMKELNN